MHTRFDSPRLEWLACPERLLRWSLGVVCLWFGLLKAFEVSPVSDLLLATAPPVAAVPLFCLLILFELTAGMLLLLGRWTRWVALAVVAHLVGTLVVTLAAPAVAFAPAFPVLTLEGEFVVKKLVLLASAAAVAFGVEGPGCAAWGRERG